MSSGPDIDNASNASTSTFVTALVFNCIVLGVEIAAFTLLRPYFPSIYQPRTYAPPENRRAKSLTDSMFGWPIAIFKADHNDIINANGLDAYFFVRFLRMIVRILLPIWFFSWVVLMPVTSVNTSVPGNSGLDIFIFGNVAADKQARYAAHIILAWFFTFWIWWNLKKELGHFVITRQKWMIGPDSAGIPQSSTVLVTGIPKRYLSESALTELFNILPGGVRKVWLNRDLKDMPDLYERRLKACNKLESAETGLLRMATKLHNQKLKADAKAAKKSGGKGASDPSVSDGQPLANPSVTDTERNDAAFVPENKRPKHRLGFLGLFGKKVDSIEWARTEIAETSSALEESRKVLAQDVARTSDSSESDTADPESLKPTADGQTYQPLNAAFILFNQQIAAHIASTTLTHHAPYRMTKRYVGVAPEDVIWSNLSMNPYESRIRTALSWAATAALIIFWSVPVAFVGAVSNIHAICSTFSWLNWICNLPSVVVGIISGILPPVLLAVLMMLLPIVLRLFSKLEGTPTRTAVELSLMTRYFLFQVIHSFLIVTLSAGIFGSLDDLINSPTSIPTILAQKLPTASNFFLTYIVLQGLSGTAAGFLQAVPLVVYYVKLVLLGSTPRSVYNIKYGLRNVAWGTLWPGITLLVVVTITYSIISPVINGLAFVTFFFFYELYKYLFLWQLDQPRSGESGGLFFPKAIQHVFVGLYLQQICLAALFFLAQDETGKQSAIPEGALMVVLIVLTIFFQYILNNSYGPLLSDLPLTLAKSAGVLPAPPSPPASPDTSKHPQKPHDSVIEMSSTSDLGANTHGVGEDFAHPASVAPQQVVWLPRDTLGLITTEEAGCRDAGILVSTEGAEMDGKGKVDISGQPPEAPEGGINNGGYNRENMAIREEKKVKA